MFDTDIDMTEDSLTRLNTQLNRSMVLMDQTANEEVPLHKSAKSIKINTKIQPASPSGGSNGVSRKSILKKSDKAPSDKEVNNEPQTIESELERLNNAQQEQLSIGSSVTPRPYNLQDLVAGESLTIDSTSSTFNLDDISDSEDIWIMDVPRTIDPQELRGQTLTLGEKSKFKVNEERYCAVQHDVKYNVTCVFNTGKVKQRYKTVNIKPAGAITMRRKLSGHPQIKPMNVENSSVPFPKNLKTRHPLFGVTHEGKVKKSSIKKSV